MKDKNGYDIEIGDEVVLKGRIVRQTEDKVGQKGVDGAPDTVTTTSTVTIEAVGTDGQKRQWAFETQFVAVA